MGGGALSKIFSRDIPVNGYTLAQKKVLVNYNSKSHARIGNLPPNFEQSLKIDSVVVAKMAPLSAGKTIATSLIQLFRFVVGFYGNQTKIPL